MTSPTSTESDDDDILRLRGWLKEIGEFGMDLIRHTAPKAAAQIKEPPPSKPPTINYVAEFLRLSSAMKQIINLELRLRAADPARRSLYVRSPAANDPRQAPLRRTLFQAIVMAPDPARLHRAANERIDAELLADPDEKIPVGDILMSICKLLDIHIDLRHLPDEMLPSDDAPGAAPNTPRPRPPGPRPPLFIKEYEPDS